jgi:hypothetical protein
LRGVVRRVRRCGPLLLLVLPWLSACASGGGLAAVGWSGRRPAEPWRLPPDAYPTQRLYRVKYDGPDGHAAFKLTLYLEDEHRFRMQAADGLGRRLWELDVDALGDALWLDHRNRRYCAAPGASDLSLVPLARLPLVSLPKLLLGQLPTSPAADLRRGEDTVYYRDARGRLWNGGLTDGRLAWWTQVEAGEAVTSWRREGEDNVFVDRRGEQELRWREVVREPLAAPPRPLEVPAKYVRFDEASCG